MPATLSSGRTVMHFARRPNDQVVFLADWQPGGRRQTLTTDVDTWRDMGEPRVITVTVEPGDLLNDA